VSVADRGAFDNLILLCVSCHTEIDKAPQQYSVEMVWRWKAEHRQKLERLFGVRVYANRASLRAAIEPILDANRGIWSGYGPDSDDSQDPDALEE
jgi:hypothetical protein